MYFGGAERHLEYCLEVSLPSVGPLVWCECVLLGLSYLVKGVWFDI